MSRCQDCGHEPLPLGIDDDPGGEGPSCVCECHDLPDCDFCGHSSAFHEDSIGACNATESGSGVSASRVFACDCATFERGAK